jgi:hypothetical protein
MITQSFIRGARRNSAFILRKYLIRLQSQLQVKTKVKEFFGALEKIRQAWRLRVKTKMESVKSVVQQQVQQAVKKVKKEVMRPTKKKGKFQIDHPFIKAILNFDIVLMEQTIKNLVNFLMTKKDV